MREHEFIDIQHAGLLVERQMDGAGGEAVRRGVVGRVDAVVLAVVGAMVEGADADELVAALDGHVLEHRVRHGHLQLGVLLA